MSNLYEILGVGSDASQEGIKKAYRAKAMEAHPDRGGSVEGFQALSKAYEVLSDPERRDRYDHDGFYGDKPDPEAQMKRELAVIALTILDQIDPQRMDLIAAMKAHLHASMAHHQRQLSGVAVAIKKREDAIARLSAKHGESFLSQVLAGDIEEQRAIRAKIEEVIAHGQRLIAAMEEYDYTVDAPVFSSWMHPTTTTA